MTVETNNSEGNVILPTGTGKGILLHVEDGMVEIPMLNDKDEDQQLIKGSLFAHVELLSGSEELTPVRPVPQQKPIDRSMLNVGKDVNEQQVDALLKMLNEYRDCFALNLSELGCCNQLEMIITEHPGSSPVSCKPYTTNAEERKAIQEIVKEWKATGIITETSSPYASPVLLVKKKNGENRLVIDYRRLNSQTVPEHFPLPNIDDQLQRLSGAQIYCVLDCANGYLQLPQSEESKAKTAFITPDEIGQFERMVFGLRNGPAVFQRLMNKVLGSLRNTVALCYMDDLLIPAKDWEELLVRLKQVLDALRAAGLTLKISKCVFGSEEIDYLGFKIAKGYLQPGEVKQQAILDASTPTDVHSVRRFLGLTGFFRRFIPHYALKAETLTSLTKKDTKFTWGVEQQEAFDLLRKELTAPPVLKLYNPLAPTELHTDASRHGLAGMILQQDESGRWHLVFCVSKRTTDAEGNYHAGKLELMAIVWSMERLHPFLLGIPFTLVTDCQAIVYLNAHKTLKPQIAR